MAKQHFDEGSIKKYTLTAFISFVVVFCFLMLMMNWHGPFVPGEAHAEPSAHIGAENKHAETVEAALPAEKPESIKVTLPDGTQLDAYKGGIEEKLVVYLNDSTSKAGKDVWFDFDNLNFKLNSAEITPESNVQVLNIAAILKAYPKLKVKVGGYTDKTGDSAANMKLSQDRATAVVKALEAVNASASQLTGAEGYGSQHAKAPAHAPDEERVKDRRISLSIREK